MKFNEFNSKKNIIEGKMSELDLDMKDKKMSDFEFKAKYKKSRDDVKKEINHKKKVDEAASSEKVYKNEIIKTPTGLIHRPGGDAEDMRASTPTPKKEPKDSKSPPKEVPVKKEPRGDKLTTKQGVVHKSKGNYSGKYHSSSSESNYGSRTQSHQISLPDGGRMGGSHSSRSFKEATGDKKFDKMMGNITGSDTPKAIPAQGTGQIDRQIMELTHKIFLRLRDFDDPRVYQKFIDFMVKTINNDVGPLDEERNLSPAPKSVVNMENALASVRQSLVNASINVEPYDRPEFRLSQIDEAIRKLNYIRNLLMTDVTIGNARK